MKRLCIFILLLLFVSCNNQTYRNQVYNHDVKSAIDDAEWLSFDVSVKKVFSDGETALYNYSIISHFALTNPFYIIIEKEAMRAAMINEKEAFVVDNQNRELSHFSTNKDNESNFYYLESQQAFSKIEHLSFYTQSFPKKLINQQSMPLITNISDTTINYIPCRKYEALLPKKWILNDNTNEFDIPLQYASCTWLNRKTNQVDSIFVYQITKNDFGAISHYQITHLNKEDKVGVIDSIFNFDNPTYVEYSRHTESFPPFSIIGSSNENINESLLCLSLTNTEQDTTVLGNIHGWILLDLWQFGCKPCYQEFEKQKHENDSLGFRILEKEGLSIIAANAFSDNMKLLEEIASKYENKDVLYSAKGIFSMLSLVNHSFPSYYLISPEKEIIWRSNSLGDYSELLEAKANYEIQHQNR